MTKWMLLIPLLLAVSCQPSSSREVVVYTALDNVFSREIFQLFEQRTGIRVRPVFDTEATKTTGLVERIRRERKNPQCDVFWNNEILRTIRLADEGILAAYSSPSAADIPEEFKDPDGLWTGFAARARVVAFLTHEVASEAQPKTHGDLLADQWRDKLAIADPRFGTTGTHLALLLAHWGEPRLRAFLTKLQRQGVRVVSGNSASRDRVVSGDVVLGLTDTDDVEVVRRRGVPIDCSLLPGDGVILIPNTVALLRGAPRPDEGRVFIDFLLSREVEELLAASPSRQIPLRADVPVPETGLRYAGMTLFSTDYRRAAALLPAALQIAREIFSL